LKSEGYEVLVEDQNSFQLAGKNGGILAGKADILAINGEDLLVIDCKTGQEKNSDKLQVLLYMLCLPESHGRCLGKRLRGEVQYRTNSVSVPANKLDDRFRLQVKRLMDLATGKTPPDVKSQVPENVASVTFLKSNVQNELSRS